MSLSEQQIRDIVNQTMADLNCGGASYSQPSYAPSAPWQAGRWLCDTAEEAIENAKASQKILQHKTSLEERGRLIEAMRQAARANAKHLAEAAHNETGYGNVPNKTAKNLLAANKTPGIEDLHPTAYTGDYGLTLVEEAPYGVIGSITPSTNPTATVINNSISMIAAGNAVVYNPHPGAKRSSQEAMRVLNDAIVAAGGPPALIACPKEPTVETSKIIMHHPDIRMLSITGGEAVVNIAMRVGKKVIAAGPGNPPVVVDETAIIPKAAKDIVIGASFDNNVLCIAEKEVFAVNSIADRLMDEMEKNNAVRVYGADIDKIVNTVLNYKDGKYTANKNFVGRDATHILRESGVHFNGNPCLVIAEVDKNHPFVMVEMLMPVLAIVRVGDVHEGIRESVRAEQGCHHSAYIHSTNVNNMSEAATALDTTIFGKNCASLAGLGDGGEGYTTLTIATPTGEGLTSAKSFTRKRRCVLKGDFWIV